MDIYSKCHEYLKHHVLSSSIFKWMGKFVPVERIFSGVFWTSIGNVVSSLASLSSSLVLANILGAVHYGKFSVIQSTLAVFMVLTGPSIGFLATKHIAEHRHLNPRRAAAILKLSNMSALILSMVMAVALLLLSPYLAGSIMRTPELQPELYLSAAILLFTGVNGAQLGALSGFEAFREVAITNIFKGIFTFLLVVLGGYYDGIRGAISGLAVVSMLVCAFSNHYVAKLQDRHNLPYISKADLLAEMKLLFSFSLPNWLYSIVTSLANLCTQIMVSRIPQGYAQMGIFNAANQFFLMLNFLPTILWQVSLPMLSGVSGKKDFVKLRESYRKLIIINLAAITLLICLLVPISGMLMNWLGKEFAGQTKTLIAALLLTPVYASANVAWQIMIVLGRMWSSLLIVLLHSLIYIGLSTVFINHGAYGLAVARLIAHCINAAVYILYVEIELAKKIKHQRENIVF